MMRHVILCCFASIHYSLFMVTFRFCTATVTTEILLCGLHDPVFLERVCDLITIIHEQGLCITQTHSCSLRDFSSLPILSLFFLFFANHPLNLSLYRAYSYHVKYNVHAHLAETLEKKEHKHSYVTSHTRHDGLTISHG